ncbi:hypothetical protein [Bdellovibrio sp. HCB2-146]|uniref:hypothetical protein n=1 Tax=Bdellovibrio sp. HCB2-146 TaxID=3394362 RepID=UPI0039BC5A6A
MKNVFVVAVMMMSSFAAEARVILNAINKDSGERQKPVVLEIKNIAFSGGNLVIQTPQGNYNLMVHLMRGISSKEIFDLLVKYNKSKSSDLEINADYVNYPHWSAAELTNISFSAKQ